MSKQLGWIIAAIVLLAGFWTWRSNRATPQRAVVRPSLEDRMPDGSPFNPSTQSFLRGKHGLEQVEAVEITVDGKQTATLQLQFPNASEAFRVQGLPLDQLVPRLHYDAAEPADAFDAYNLMLAEFSRNSLSVPTGKASDAMAHFETSFPETTPWTLEGDYDFHPNGRVRPIRFGVINNCLAAGLWELSAQDRTGEIYHAWFDMPTDLYFDLMAHTNGLEKSFVEAAVTWRSAPVALELDRLRRVDRTLDVTSLTTIDGLAIGFSSQDSRRKLHKSFVEIQSATGWRNPTQINDLTQSTSRFSNFEAPGKYSRTNKKEFDLRFLRAVEHAEVRTVVPLTDYNWRHARQEADPTSHATTLELELVLGEHALLLGNLPLRLLVPQEEYELHGFGVGILASGGIAERRRYLIEQGPAPSFAYLVRYAGQQRLGLNSHDFGIEQIFIRTHLGKSAPWLEITVTSYERIVDIVKYHVELPPELHEEFRQAAMRYISPLYRTYRDDNIR